MQSQEVAITSIAEAMLEQLSIKERKQCLLIRQGEDVG